MWSANECFMIAAIVAITVTARLIPMFLGPFSCSWAHSGTVGNAFQPIRLLL